MNFNFRTEYLFMYNTLFFRLKNNRDNYIQIKRPNNQRNRCLQHKMLMRRNEYNEIVIISLIDKKTEFFGVHFPKR